MSSFAEKDQEYCAAILAPGTELSKAFEKACSIPKDKIDLNENDITVAVLLRLKAFYECQDLIKFKLQKVYAAPAADFFVETICFFLKVILLKLEPTLSVKSEESVVKKSGSMRPDITIWQGDKLIAAVECKTQLGWNRDNWLVDFEQRESKLKKYFPNADMFLVVMTASNWGGFGDDKRAGSKFFVLLKNKMWPREFTTSNMSEIVHRVESLLEAVIGCTSIDKT